MSLSSAHKILSANRICEIEVVPVIMDVFLNIYADNNNNNKNHNDKTNTTTTNKSL